MKRKTILIWLLLVISQACRTIPSEARTFENEMFSFTIPAGWQMLEEVWDRPSQPGQEYYGLGVQEIVMIQYPPDQGQGIVFFGVATSSLADGQELESRFTQAYQMAVPEIEGASIQPFQRGELSGYEITYKRPWGEPWWQFRDIWLEKDGVIYVLSFHASPDSFDTHIATFTQILESFRFEE